MHCLSTSLSTLEATQSLSLQIWSVRSAIGSRATRDGPARTMSQAETLAAP
jgi:hypothetical protein